MSLTDGSTKPFVDELGDRRGTCNSNREKGPSAGGMTIVTFTALTGWIAMPGGWSGSTHLRHYLAPVSLKGTAVADYTDGFDAVGRHLRR